MAIAYVKEVGKNTGNATTLVIAVAAAPAAGSMVILRIGFRGSATVTISSVVDSKGNTWAIDVQNNASGGHAALASTEQDIGTLTTSDTITITFSAAPANGAASIADEFSGLATTPTDQTQSGTATTTARAGGTTGTTTQADELVVGCYAGNGTETSFTKDAAYLDFTTKFLVAAIGTTAFVEGQYKIISTTGNQTAPATGGLSVASVGVIGTYKMATGGGGTAFSKTPADSVATSDTPTTATAYHTGPVDTVSTSDTATKAAGYHVSAADSTTPVDSFSDSEGFRRTAADAVTTSDVLSRTASFFRSVAESVGLVDVAGGNIPAPTMSGQTSIQWFRKKVRERNQSVVQSESPPTPRRKRRRRK